MVRRIIHVLVANLLFLVVSVVFWLAAVLVEATVITSTVNLVAGSVMVLLFSAVFMLVMTMPSALCSALVYVIGGFFNSRGAMIAAALVGSLLMFLALSGDAPRKWAMEVSAIQAALLALLYGILWLAVGSVTAHLKPHGLAQ